jgi:hypothetical protein
MTARTPVERRSDKSTVELHQQKGADPHSRSALIPFVSPRHY